VAYLKLGDHENAKAAFLNALALDPQMEQAKKNLLYLTSE
jgi:Flp pilus assembly protein TadD